MAEGQLTIVGPCKEVTVKSGWHTFAVTVPGKQYPVKLSTKLPALVDAATAVGEANAVWTYTESEGAENPNKPGTNYINRRLERVELASAEAVAAAAANGGIKGGGGGRDADTSASIERQVIVKSVIHLYPEGLITDDATFFAFLARLDAFISGTAFSGRGGTKVEAPAAAGGVSDAPPPDDDIPF